MTKTSCIYKLTVSGLFPITEQFLLSKECWYFVRDGQKFVRKDETSDAIKMKASTNVDKDLREALTGEDGLMRCGALPQVSTASTAGNQKLLEAIDKARDIHSTRVDVVGIKEYRYIDSWL